MNMYPNKHREKEVRNLILYKINEHKKTKTQTKGKKLLLNKLILEIFNTNDLSGIDLSNIDFNDCCLDYLNLSSCDLSNCKFSNASLMNTNLSNSKLANADFTNASLISTLLNNTTISNLKFKNAIIHFTNFSGAKLNNVDFSKSDVTQPNFSNAQLNRLDLHELDLSHSNFTHCDLRKCNFNKSILSHANFFEAHLNEVDFEYSDLSESCFMKSSITSVSFYEALLTKANLSYSTLSYKLRKSIYETLSDIFTDNGTGMAIYVSAYERGQVRTNIDNEEQQIMLQFRKECENMYQLQRSRDLNQVNIYRVDGIPTNDDENTLLKNGCIKKLVTEQEIAKLKNSGGFNLNDATRFCLFKASNQVSSRSIENKKLSDSINAAHQKTDKTIPLNIQCKNNKIR